MPNILITGAATGLGLALSREFYSNGWTLFLLVRRTESVAALVDEFPSAQILVSDIRNQDHQTSVAKWLAHSKLDVLINNAGAGSAGPNISTATAEQITSVFQTNCVGVFSTVKGALPALKRASSARVLNISSRRASLQNQAAGAAKGRDCSYAYRISKAAQNMLTLCLADDLEDDGIAVAAIHPGRLLTQLASEDANMTPEQSAETICQWVLSHKIKNRDFLCVESGVLPW